jgi:hypothetical protein
VRTVNLSLAEIPNQPLASARVTFRPLKKGQSTTADVYPSRVYTVTTNANGDATLQLPTDIEIEVTLPDGWRGTIIVPPGATPITLQALLLSNATPPNNWQVLLDAHEQKIAGVGPSGVLGHVRVDGATILVNPSTGVISSTASGGAPTNAQYLVAAADPTLTAERVATNTATVEWDFTTPGQAKASVADGSIDTQQLANNAVTGPKIASNAVTASKIAANAVTTPKIQDGAVLYDKIQDVTANRLLGRGATAGPPEEIQIGTNLSLSGGVLSASGGATNLGYVQAPASGQVTSSTGTPATIPQADTTNAGLLNPTDKNKLNHYQLDTATNRIALGQTALPSGTDNTSLGVGQTISAANWQTAVGSSAQVLGDQATAIGYFARANLSSVAVGASTVAGINGGQDCVVVGYGSTTGQGNGESTALGPLAGAGDFIGGGATVVGARAYTVSPRHFILSSEFSPARPAGTKFYLLHQITTSDVMSGRYAGGMVFQWLDNLPATRRGRTDVVACDAASNERVGFSVDSSGTQARVSVLGATPIPRATAPPAASDLATAITLVNALRQLMIDFGLWEA